MILTRKAPNSPCLVTNLNLSNASRFWWRWNVYWWDTSLHHLILEKSSNEAFQALWIELSFVSKKNTICGIFYRQHNSPARFLEYFEQTLENFISTGKYVCVMGDFSLCLLKSEVSEFSHNFLRSCYLIPTTDKPSRVRGNSASLIENIFVNNPDCVSVSGKKKV